MACRQFPAKDMDDQGGRNIHSVPCLNLLKPRVAYHVGTKEGGVYNASKSAVYGARRERHYRVGLAHVGRQPVDTGQRAHYDVASCPKCVAVPVGGKASDPGVIPADHVDQAEAARVVARVKTKGRVTQEERCWVIQHGRGLDLVGKHSRFVSGRSVGGVYGVRVHDGREVVPEWVRLLTSKILPIGFKWRHQPRCRHRASGWSSTPPSRTL